VLDAAALTGQETVMDAYCGCGTISLALARQAKKACDSAKQLVYSVTVITILVAALVVLIRVPMLRLFFGKIEDDVMEACLIYLVISAFSFPFMALYNSGAALFRAMGNSAVTFKISVLMNLINVVGNAICVFGLKMGVAGVAVPTLIARMVGSIVIIQMLRNPNLQIHLEKGRYIINMAEIKKIFFIGIPSGVENGLFQLGRVVLVSIISGFGTVQIAANGVANSLDAMGCIIGQAMNLAMITVIGQCVGAGDERQIRYYLKKLLIITYSATAVMNSIILMLLHPILSLYGLGPETTELAYTLVFIHNLCAIFCWPSAFVFPNMLRACNDVRYTMLVSVFSMIAFRIGFSIVFGVYMNMGAIGVWIAMVIDWLFRIAMFWGRYFAGTWRKKAHLA